MVHVHNTSLAVIAVENIGGLKGVAVVTFLL
jgi:hypothetical protein